MLTCVYHPPGSCSESFLDQFLSLLEYLSSVSHSFLICGDFNIHVDTSSNDSIKFQNCLESCNISQNVQTATHRHGHILHLVLTPTDASVISNVQVAVFISDHALVLAQLDSVNPRSHKAKVVTFRMYHKIEMDSFSKDLENSAFVKLPSITRLVNCSLSEGVVPEEFKKAIVTPLIKKSSLLPNDLKNYRPVSGLGFISKLVERVVASQLNDHVSLNGLENVRQSAYKLGHSTESALLSIKNDVHLAFAKVEATAVVLLDQSATFDTLLDTYHDTLLNSLSSWFGVSGVVLDWFKSYFSDRVQCIKIGSILSDAKKYGVPQGSVLGPILFSLYTTPLSKVIENHPDISFQLYSDDTQLYVHLTHKNVASALDKLSHCLEDVKRWLSTNKLKLNPDKTKFIVFGSKSQREKLN